MHSSKWIRPWAADKVRLLCAFALFSMSVSLPAPAQSPPAQAPGFVVVLDAAHGGSDLGGTLSAQGSQSQPEKAFTLALSVRLRSLLAARGIAVVTTRESDTTVDGERRAEIANHANAQACVSLHGTQNGTGIHIYASSLTLVRATPLTPWKSAQAVWVTRSLALAGVLNSALTHAGFTVTLGRTALPVVDSMACPAVAIEIAPESSSGSEHSTTLDEPGYQASVAQALAAALLEWRSSASRGSPSPAEAIEP